VRLVLEGEATRKDLPSPGPGATRCERRGPGVLFMAQMQGRHATCHRKGTSRKGNEHVWPSRPFGVSEVAVRDAKKPKRIRGAKVR